MRTQSHAAIAAAVIAVAAACAPSASAVSGADLEIINATPTEERAGATANPDALFSLKQPAFPGTNECKLDSGAFRPCSFFFQASGLGTGDHRLTVRQTSASGTVTTDTWPWTVRSAQAAIAANVPLEAHTYCYQGYDTAVDRAGTTNRLGTGQWQSYAAGGTDIVADAGSTDWATILMAAYRRSSQGWQGIPDRDVFDGIPAWPAGIGAPFAVSIANDANARYDGSQRLHDPTWNLVRLGGSGALSRQQAPMPMDLASCFGVHAPPGIVDNGDGTLSVTFGWSNLTPYPITAAAGTTGVWKRPSASDPTGSLPRNAVTTDAGSTVTPSGMPTQFGANSTGTWTYTFADPGADSTTPITWTVGDQSTSFLVRRANVTPAATAPAGATPFTHVDFATPTAAPTRQLSAPAPGGSAPSATTPAPGSTGGAVTARTTVRVTNRVVRPKRKAHRRGQTVHLTSTVRNTGRVDATRVRLCDRIPAGMKLVHAPGRRKVSGRTVCWTSSRLAAGTGVSGRMALRVTTTAKPGLRTNRVTVRADNVPTTAAKARFRVRR
ncbi:DUF11 domain-containing protein [Svornostia abyssi]|uniref:DUF11 domain-containing protein n=1 Tax=Svornostia abyssi TaxID=2898438 RepID=A0ABY5PMI9_9ACTN|nr:DUF11 domain-containing protein [Parviterribacteraceae bacterium J379]